MRNKRAATRGRGETLVAELACLPGPREGIKAFLALDAADRAAVAWALEVLDEHERLKVICCPDFDPVELDQLVARGSESRRTKLAVNHPDSPYALVAV